MFYELTEATFTDQQGMKTTTVRRRTSITGWRRQRWTERERDGDLELHSSVPDGSAVRLAKDEGQR